MTVLAWAVAMAVVIPALQEPSRVDRITIHNPSPWALRVEVSAAGDDRHIDMGVVDRDSDKAFELVLDVGDTWTIRYSYAGYATPVDMPRRDLQRASWQLTVPPDLAEQLRRAGVPATPP